jgi:hypothetical protein
MKPRPLILVKESAIRRAKRESEVISLADTLERKPGEKEAEEIEFIKASIYYIGAI